MSNGSRIIRSDWDILQISSTTPECLVSNQSETSSKKEKQACNLITEMFEFPRERKFREQVVKLILPPEPMFFTQTGNGPQYLLIQKPNDADMYHKITDFY